MLQNFPESDTQCININFHTHYTTIEDCCLTAACHNCLKQSVFFATNRSCILSVSLSLPRLLFFSPPQRCFSLKKIVTSPKCVGRCECCVGSAVGGGAPFGAPSDRNLRQVLGGAFPAVEYYKHFADRLHPLG